jgi:3-methyladenine DNA glycosylase/8-oxoguanine DNA glycosylase
VHRHHRASPRGLAGPPYGGRGSPQQIFAFLRPQEVTGGARTDRAAERRHRLAGVEREHHTCPLTPTEHRRCGHDRIRLELPDRFRQLPVIARGRHHTGASAPIQEVHDLLGHLRRIERQDDPRHLIHGILHASWERLRDVSNRSHRRRHPEPPGGPDRPRSAIPALMNDVGDDLSHRLPFRRPFAANTLLSFLGARCLPGVEEVRDGSYRRSARTLDGDPVVIALTPDPVNDHVTIEVSSGRPSGATELLHAARRAFDLDADPGEIDAALARDPKLAPSVRRIPGIRVPGTFDAFELVLRAIFGQQVSVSGARTSLGRFAARYGTPLDPPTGAITHLFPSAGQVAELAPDVFEMPRGRAKAIREVAELVAGGTLDLSGRTPFEETLHILGEVRGVGPWTLAYVAMRALRDQDAFMAGDLGVRKGFGTLGLPATSKELLERAERWRPWRAYAVMHLWHAHP